MNPATYCKSCGAYIPDGQKKCLACGFPVDGLPRTAKEIEDWINHGTRHFKPIENFTGDRLYSYKGYTFNEKGQVLAVPDDDSLPTTKLNDTKWKFNAITGWREQHSTPKSERIELKRLEPLPKDDEDLFLNPAKLMFRDDYYDSVIELTNKVRQNIKQLEQKLQEPKPDIDLDDLLSKQFVTVNLGGNVLKCYLGCKPIMECVDNGFTVRTMSGEILTYNDTKHKISLELVEK